MNRLATPEPARLDPLDAWILSTYQRLERLDVPAFAHLSAERRLERLQAGPGAAPGPARTPLRRVADAELLMLDGGAPRAWPLPETQAGRLSLLLRYLGGPLRYEPGTENALHKSVPSSRGLFPLAYILLLRREEGAVAYEYVPQHHALRRLAPHAAQQAAPTLADGVPAALLCIARVWRIAEIYGEFAHFPCTLEAGHAHAQCLHLAAALGMQLRREVGREAGRAFCRHAFDLPLFAVALQLGAFEHGLAPRPVRLGEPAAPEALAPRFARLPEMQRLFDGGAGHGLRWERGAGSAPTGPAAPAALLRAMRQRSAGNDRGGIAACLPVLPEDLCARLLRDWRTLRQARAGLACEDGLALSLAWLGDGATPAGLCLDDGRVLPSRLSTAEFRRSLAAMLPFPGLRLNLSTLAAIGIVEVDPATALAQQGESALRDMHLAAGAVAHDLSLAAAAHGLFARPVRMMREAALETALNLRGQVIYLVLLGVARRTRLSMELF